MWLLPARIEQRLDFGTTMEEQAKDLSLKEAAIRRVLQQNDGIDVWKLRDLALTQGGLVNGECVNLGFAIVKVGHANLLLNQRRLKKKVVAFTDWDQVPTGSVCRNASGSMQ